MSHITKGPVLADIMTPEELAEMVKLLKSQLVLAKEALEDIANAGGFNSSADAETAREALEKLK